VATERKADLVVMGTHGRRGLSHVFFGSVAERIVRTSPAPVLTTGPSDLAGDSVAAFRHLLIPTDFGEPS
jgi:universal stress protein family protein